MIPSDYKKYKRHEKKHKWYLAELEILSRELARSLKCDNDTAIEEIDIKLNVAFTMGMEFAHSTVTSKKEHEKAKKRVMLKSLLNAHVR